jgi:nitrite reductase/ring-hydroxylating ferredoxin subunit
VLGGPHADPDLGQPRRHRHADERFLLVAEHRYLGSCQAHRFLTVMLAEDAGEPVLQPRVCQKRMPLHPTHWPVRRNLSLVDLIYPSLCHRGDIGCGTGRIRIRNHEALEARFVGKRAVHDLCPHWGTPLGGQRVWTTSDGRKIRVCPSHALCFELETGLFVPSPDIELSGEDDPYGTLGDLRARVAAGLRQAVPEARQRVVASGEIRAGQVVAWSGAGQVAAAQTQKPEVLSPPCDPIGEPR